jgi:hypothetical protein
MLYERFSDQNTFQLGQRLYHILLKAVREFRWYEIIQHIPTVTLQLYELEIMENVMGEIRQVLTTVGHVVGQQYMHADNDILKWLIVTSIVLQVCDT